jgi:hypothetical protein
MSRRGILSGTASGLLGGFGAGMKSKNPLVTAGATLLGGVAGALGASADDQMTEEERQRQYELEQQKLAEEKRMNNQNILQSNRTAGMSALNYLGGMQGAGNIRARTRQIRDLVLRGA